MPCSSKRVQRSDRLDQSLSVRSKSFQDVVNEESDVWSYQQYAVVREYYDRPPLCVPLSTIFDIIALLTMLYQWYLRQRYHYANPAQRVFSKSLVGAPRSTLVCLAEVIAVQPELEVIWQEFESASTYAFAQQEALSQTRRSVGRRSNIDRRSLVLVEIR